MKISLIEDLKCPECGGIHFEVMEFETQKANGSGNQIYSGILICRTCRKWFPISQSLLQILPDSLRKSDEDLQFYQHFKNQFPPDAAPPSSLFENIIACADEKPRVIQKEVFETSSAFDKRSASRNHQLKIRKIIELIPAEPSVKILEVGVGNGRHAEEIAKQLECRYTGIDFSSQLLKKATARTALYHNSHIVQADALSIPFQDDLFDQCFCVSTLHHLFSAEKGISEMMRVLKPGGIFIALEPNHLLMKKFFRSLTRRGRQSHTDTSLSSGNLKLWSNRLGASDVSIDYLIYTPNSPIWMARIFDYINSAMHGLHFLRRLAVMKVITWKKNIPAAK